MPDIATAIIGGTTLFTGVIGSGASKSSARAQERAAEQSTAAQLEMYYQGREDMAPWREGGAWALGELRRKITAGPGEYTKSPGYEARLGEGVKTMERGAAARGNVLSGAQQRDLTQFGQDYATQDYDNFLRRYYQSLTPYQSMAGQGQTTAAQTAQMGQQTGYDVGQNYLAAGRARASGYINQANVWGGAMKSGTENYLMWDYLNRRNPTGPSPWPTQSA